MATFILMNKNTKLFSFIYDETNHYIIDIDKIFCFDNNYFPLGIFNENNVDLNKFIVWWKNRNISLRRDKIKKYFIKNNIVDLLDLNSYFLSLTDPYWIRKQEDNVKWENINYFFNSFNENELLNSPNLSTNGDLDKSWILIDNKRYLIKEGNKINNQEVYNEVIASKLYERILNQNEFVKYSLYNYNERNYSICESFISSNTELIPAYQVDELLDYLPNENKYDHYIRCLDYLNIKDGNVLIDKMIVCDFILANKDRHYNNFGVIRNANTFEFISGPIYDNGCSLWYDENDKYIGEFFLTKPFLEYEKDQIELVKNIDWLDFDKLKGFTNIVRDILESNDLLSKDRIDKIINEINDRIDYIFNLYNR